MLRELLDTTGLGLLKYCEHIEGDGPIILAHACTLGVEGIVSANLGGVSFDLLGGYDTEWEEGAIRALLSADLGPGTLQVAGIWASNPNTYWRASEWSVAASYAFKATDKLKITPGVQYWDSLRTGNEFNNDLEILIDWVGKARPADYGRYAPLVLQHAEERDPLGIAIIEDAAAGLSAIGMRLLDLGAPAICLFGGLSEPLRPWLSPPVQRTIADPLADALDGAILLARMALRERRS